MIKTKNIRIIKENQFDKGWTLFQPFSFACFKNQFYKPVFVNDVIRLITYSTKVDLILSEACLSSRIVDEIKWVNKYIELNLIAKSKTIVERYSELKLSSAKIDSTIGFNYIGILGKNNGYFVIDNSFVEIGDSYEKSFFKNENISENFSFLNDAQSLIIIGANGLKEHDALIEEAKKNKINVKQIVNVSSFDKGLFLSAKREKIELLISKSTKDAGLLIKNNGTIYRIEKCKFGFYITYPIENLYNYFSDLHKSCFFEDLVKTEALTEDCYSFHDGRVEKLDIKDKKVINLDKSIELMSDFVLGKFDSNIVEKHNDYSAEAKKVEYNFRLIPPMLDESYVESRIYDIAHNLADEWNLAQTLETVKIKTEYSKFSSKDFGIIELLNKSDEFTKELNDKVSNCSYVGFHQLVNDTLRFYELTYEGLIGICKKTFEALNETTSVIRFDKFDAEIESYQKTIVEKNKLIEMGKDVLSNKRRVEILTDKINKLLELKQKFESTESSRNDKGLSAFLLKCESLLKNEKEKGNADSIGNIVCPKEETNLSKFEMFLSDYLYGIHEYLKKAIEILKKLSEIHVPEEYKVYDYNNERFIAISELEEYETTKDIRNEFNLKCVAKEVLR